MKTKIFLTLEISALIAIIAININIARLNSTKFSSLTLNNIESAFSESFEFDGQTWNDTDTHSYGSRWKPVKINCTGYNYNYQGQPTSSYSGKMIQCQAGNGNCSSTATYRCIGDPA
jgi:hypothetical protein